MIEIATVFAGVFLAQAAPGPNMMAVASSSLGTGRAAGIATTLGVATGVLVWCMLFAFGVGAVLQAVPETLTAMRLLGGGYLLFLGIKALRASLAPTAAAGQAGAVSMSRRAAYRRGLLVVMTNPKAALMWVAVSMFLASSGLSSGQFVIIGFGASLSATLIYGTYAILFSTGVAVRGYRRFFRLIEGAFGAVFGILGGRLLFDGIRALRA